MGAFSPLVGVHFSSTRNHALSAECIKFQIGLLMQNEMGTWMQAYCLVLTIKN